MVRYSVGFISGLVFLGLWLQTQGNESHVCVISGATVSLYVSCKSQGKLLNITEAYYRLPHNICSFMEDGLLPCRGDMEALTQDVRTRCNGRSSCTYLFTHPVTTDCDENFEGDIAMFIFFECYSDSQETVTTTVSSDNNSPEVITNASPTDSPTPSPGDSAESTELPGFTSANLHDSSQQTLAPVDGAVLSLNNTEQAPVWPIAVGVVISLLVLVVIIVIVVKLRIINMDENKNEGLAHLQETSAGQENVYAMSDTTAVENGPGFDPNAMQNGAVSTATRYSTGEESPYGYDTPCVVNPDEAENTGHYADRNDLTTDITNQAENNTHSLPSIEDVSLNYIYDDPCDVKLDETGAEEF